MALITAVLYFGVYFKEFRNNEEFKKVTENKTENIKVFEPNWESIKKHYKDPEWFNQQKFGIFIHWGAYTVPAYGSEWYPRNMYMDSAQFTAELKPQRTGPSNENKHHVKNWGNLKDFGYKDFIPMFKGEKFNAKQYNSNLDELNRAGG